MGCFSELHPFIKRLKYSSEFWAREGGMKNKLKFKKLSELKTTCSLFD